MKTYPWRRASRVAPAFTLVEILVVIFVLSVLAGILIPSMTAVRTAAKQTATGALLNTLGSGLDMFKSDPKLGRNYPPSFWNTMYGSPYSGSTDSWVAYGAQTLVWGLAGADLLGTPGFQVDPNVPILMSNDTDGLYELDANKNPAKARFGPFIDLSKTKIKKPSETKRPGNNVYDRAPVIVDSFDMPVLYFAPDPNFSDVEMYLPSGRDSHNDGFLDPNQDPIANQTKFHNYILDTRAYDPNDPAKRLSPIPVPHNRDSYLLITPGPDRYYGTNDDVANFPFNPQTMD
ncbi:MAG: type II secretion system GspH family protein [Phycisphaerae bacterium]|nr:type II secretion system GspH family protein [Phycisphaerae bacterium]